MAIGINFSCGGPSEGAYPRPGQPSPFKYTVEAHEIAGKHSIILARYPDCTTFNGFKLMLCRGIEEPVFPDALDPHLLGGGHRVIARFEPTHEGLRLARVCAEELSRPEPKTIAII